MENSLITKHDTKDLGLKAGEKGENPGCIHARIMRMLGYSVERPDTSLDS